MASAEQNGVNAPNGLRIPNYKSRRRAAQIILLTVLLCGLSVELLYAVCPGRFTGKLWLLHLLAPMEALPHLWQAIHGVLSLMLSLPLLGWVLIAVGKPRARLLIVYPVGTAVILDLCFMFLHAIRGASHWLPAELGFAVLEGLPLLLYATLVSICLHFWQPK